MEVLPISNKELQINEQIRDKEVRVVDSDGTQLGILPSGRPWTWRTSGTWIW